MTNYIDGEVVEHDRPLGLPDQVYVLWDDLTGVERIFYVGIALRPKNRFGDHLRVAKRGKNTAAEYEHMRFCGLDHIFMRVVDERGEFTEAQWRAELERQGCKLLNVAECVNVKRKRRETYKHTDAMKGGFGKGRTSGTIWGGTFKIVPEVNPMTREEYDQLIAHPELQSEEFKKTQQFVHLYGKTS